MIIMVDGVKVQRVIDQAHTVIEPGKKISIWIAPNHWTYW